MWILIDNDDSFTHILWDYIRRFHRDTIVIHIHEGKDLEAIIALQPERLILSPGPGHPSDALLSQQLVDHFYNKIPILGICLGHQVLGQHFGAQCITSGQPLHGKTSLLQLIHPHPVFQDIPAHELVIMHYHSLVVTEYAHTELVALGVDPLGQLMAMCHAHYPILGLQFHPESILTVAGEQMIENWVKMY